MMMEEWTPDGFRKGVYSGFIVQGFKYFGPRGEVGWHTTSLPNENPVHNFGVLDSTFHHIAVHILDPQFGNRNTLQVGHIVEDLDPSEKEAVLTAIEEWEQQWLDIESVIEEETRRLPSNFSHTFEGRPSDLTIGSDGQRIAFAALTTLKIDLIRSLMSMQV